MARPVTLAEWNVPAPAGRPSVRAKKAKPTSTKTA